MDISTVKKANQELAQINPPTAKVIGQILKLLQQDDRLAEKVDRAELEQFKRDIDVIKRLAQKAENLASGLDVSSWKKVDNHLARLENRLDRLEKQIDGVEKREIMLYHRNEMVRKAMVGLVVYTLVDMDEAAFKAVVKQVIEMRRENEEALQDPKSIREQMNDVLTSAINSFAAKESDEEVTS